ncbi:MAG TPA: cupin domain-containing protein [Chloroflexota bacterium]|jgi:mannose-6-phosphate isomerase-like protein (cupin superfamily)
MTIHVFDVRTDLSNLVVQPQIRSRFRRVELGPVPDVHSHDLGGETFLVMEGRIEFTVAGESVVCEPGQVIYVPPRTTHAVRAVGDAPGVIYLSVSPHVEPTHTFYDAQGQRSQPRYGVWREAGGGDPDSDPPDVLLERYRAAAAQLAALASANTASDATARDDIWATLRPLLEQIEVLEHAWNALAVHPS